MTVHSFIQRHVTPLVLKGLQQSPCIYLSGQRQAGKSTLCHHIAKELGLDYYNFDDINLFEAASLDPTAFIRGIKKPAVLDEVQLVPAIFRVLKQIIDETRLNDKAQANGRFLLTGSSHLFALPALSDALVGRMQVYYLFPISLAEYYQSEGSFLTKAFTGGIASHTYTTTHSFEYYLNKSTLPELIDQDESFMKSYYGSYLNTLVQRDIKSLIDVDNLVKIPTILQLIASRVGSIFTDSSIASDIQLSSMTYKKYKTILSSYFLLFETKPWFGNIGKRLTKSSKTYLSDTVLLLQLLNSPFGMINPLFKGLAFENFIACELLKQISLHSGWNMYHLRTSDNKEIDFILEQENGDLLAIETKASTTVTKEDFKQLRWFQSKNTKMQAGLVIYQGNQLIPFGQGCYAVPFQALFS